MGREPVHIFLGDLHAGSKLAPLVPFTDADGVNYAPSKLQAYLLTLWRDCLSDVKSAARGCDVVLHLGGDLVDGVAHHGTTQTVLDHNGQRDLAVELLRPWVNLSAAAYGLLGTDAHVRDNGQDDASVCKELGVPAKGYWRIECEGLLLDWAHHASGARLRLEASLLRLADNIQREARRREPPERVPDLIVRHHVHRYARARFDTTEAVTVPGWQAQTSFTRRHDPAGLLSVGVVAWWPKRREIRPFVYDHPAEPIVKVRLGQSKASAVAG